MQSVRDRDHKNLILALCCLAQFMVILDVSVVNVALPSIRNDLGFSTVNLQWVVNGYTLTFAGFLLLGGRAADLLGHRRVFVAGLMLFTAASLAGGLSDSQSTLIVARGFQGLGGAIVAPVTLSVLMTSFGEGAERNRALAVWGAMGGAGGAAGVLLGGILTDLLGWQWILFINVPIGIAAALAAFWLVAPGRADAAGERHYDAAGAVSITASLIVLTYAIVRTDVHGWGSASTLELMALGFALLLAFLVIEGRLAKRPLVPLRIFSASTLSAANIVVFFLGASAFSMWYFLSLYLQQVLGYSPIRAGLSFLPMTGALIIASTLAGRFVARFGAGRMLTAGMALIAVGMALFSPLSADGSFLGNVFVPGIIAAAGLGTAFVTVTITALAGVERADAGLASGLINTSRQFGGSLGLAVLATIAGSSSAHAAHGGPIDKIALTHGFHTAFIVGACFGAAGAATSALTLARRPRLPAVATAGSDA